MGTVYGRGMKPLPPGLEVGLRGLGFRMMTNVPEGMLPEWRVPKFPRIHLRAAAANTPGSGSVTARWGVRDSTIEVAQDHIDVDELLRELESIIDKVKRGEL